MRLFDMTHDHQISERVFKSAIYKGRDCATLVMSELVHERLEGFHSKFLKPFLARQTRHIVTPSSAFRVGDENGDVPP